MNNEKKAVKMTLDGEKLESILWETGIEKGCLVYIRAFLMPNKKPRLGSSRPYKQYSEEDITNLKQIAVSKNPVKSYPNFSSSSVSNIRRAWRIVNNFKT